MRWSYKNADAIVAVSAGVAADLADYIDVEREAIHVIYNPVIDRELIRLSFEPVDHPWLCDPDIPVVLAAGRLTEQKDFGNLLDAFRIVLDGMDARLIILGEGELRDALERKICTLGIQAKVSLPGFKENPYALMRRSNLFVLSSQREGFGNVLVEALACGTQVVSTDCQSGPAEILQDGKYGKLVKVGDPVGLASMITKSLRSPISEDHSQKFIEKYSIEKGVQEYMNVLLPER